MPSNKDLKTDIEALCAARSAPVPDLTNLNNPKLIELLESLKQQTPPSDAAPAAPEQPAARPLVAPSPPADPDPVHVTPPVVEAPAVAAAQAAVAPTPLDAPVPTPVMLNGVVQTRYFVAEGKVVQGLGDPKGSFEQITARDLAGGQEQLDAFVASGFVTTR